MTSKQNCTHLTLLNSKKCNIAKSKILAINGWVCWVGSGTALDIMQTGQDSSISKLAYQMYIQNP